MSSDKRHGLRLFKKSVSPPDSWVQDAEPDPAAEYRWGAERDVSLGWAFQFHRYQFPRYQDFVPAL